MGLLSKLFSGGNSKKPIANLPGPGMYALDIVGESKYQKALETICGGRKDESQERIVQAMLILEDDNPYDRNAVRVDIQGKTVGYLSRENAKEYRKRIKEAGHPDISALCSAKIVGGWDRSDGDKGYFGVKLDLPIENREPEDSKGLPSESEFIFAIDQPNGHEISETRIGDPVDLWAPDDDPTKIRVYRLDTAVGQGRLGLVPKKYARLIASQMALQLPIETEILEISTSSCTIRCKLVSAEEVKREKEKEQQKLRAELDKPYRPKKPVEFSVDAKSLSLEIGERFKLVEIPSIDEWIANIYGAVLVFASLDGKKIIEKRDEPFIKKRIVRLAHTFNNLDIRVLSKANEKPWYEGEYKLQIIPGES